MGMEHWWNDNEVPVPTCPPKIIHFWASLKLNPSIDGEGPAYNHLNYKVNM
jgi:hypothetical protein